MATKKNCYYAVGTESARRNTHDMSPVREGYQAALKRAKYLSKFRGENMLVAKIEIVANYSPEGKKIEV